MTMLFLTSHIIHDHLFFASYSWRKSYSCEEKKKFVAQVETDNILDILLWP